MIISIILFMISFIAGYYIGAKRSETQQKAVFRKTYGTKNGLFEPVRRS